MSVTLARARRMLIVDFASLLDVSRATRPTSAARCKSPFSRRSYVGPVGTCVAQVLGVCLLGTILAYVMVSGTATAAFGVVLLPSLCYVLTRRLGGLVAGLTLILLLPSWYTLGPAQAGVMRIACLCALATVLLTRQPRLTWIDVTLVGFIAILFLGWVLQDNQAHAGRIMLNEIQAVAFFIAARTVPARSTPDVMRFVYFAGALGALTVLYELRVGHVVFLDPSRYYWNGGGLLFRPGGIFGSPPAASTVLTLTALCGMPSMQQLRGWKRGFARLCMAITLGAVVATFTRTAFIAVAVGLVAYLWLSRSPMLRPQRVLVGLLLVTLGFAFVLPRLEKEATFQEGVLRPGTFAARVGYWQLAIPIATSSAHNLVVGIGSEALEIPALGGSAPSEIASSPVLIQHGTHNQYVLTLLEQGLVGLVAMCAWLAASVGTAWRRARTGRDPYVAALAAGMLAVTITMLTDNVMLSGPSLAIAFLIAGLIVASRRSGSTEDPV